MLIAALTGGIATGKSTVCRILSQAGALIVDADQIARDVVAPNQTAWKQIAAHFGPAVLEADGSINRPALAALIFSDASQKQALNAIVHPYVLERMARQIAVLAAQGPPDRVIIADIPLLMELAMESRFRQVILVYAPRATQLKRLMARDALTCEQAAARLNAQLPIDAKKEKATLVIDNSGSFDQLQDAALAAYEHLCALARSSDSQNRPWPFS
jgi:dephospho-CoA kinase